MAYETSTAWTQAPASAAWIANVPVPAPKSTTVCSEETPRRVTKACSFSGYWMFDYGHRLQTVLHTRSQHQPFWTHQSTKRERDKSLCLSQIRWLQHNVLDFIS